jgi:hypothetical protein
MGLRWWDLERQPTAAGAWGDWNGITKGADTLGSNDWWYFDKDESGTGSPQWWKFHCGNEGCNDV